MEFEIELILKRIEEAREETRILYELNRVEMLIVSRILDKMMDFPPDKLPKVLKAAAHLAELMDDLAKELMNKKGE